MAVAGQRILCEGASCALPCAQASGHLEVQESSMSKGMDQKKDQKKKPEKTLKEKRAEKRDKKG